MLHLILKFKKLFIFTGLILYFSFYNYFITNMCQCIY